MKSLESIPTAPGSRPLLGHALPLMRDPLRFLRSLPAHGDLVQVLLGPHPAIVVCDPALARHVLVNDRTFDKGGIYDVGRQALGSSLITCPHHEHRRQRRLSQPAFHPSRIAAYSRIMTEKITTVAASWVDGQVIDVQDEMLKITTAVTLAALFGTSLSPAATTQALADLVNILDSIHLRFLLPAQLRWMFFRGADYRYEEAKARFQDTIIRVVTEYRAHSEHFRSTLGRVKIVSG